MFAATLRRWFGVRSNYLDEDYNQRIIRGHWLGRYYEIILGDKRNHWCAYFRRDTNGEAMVRFFRTAVFFHLRSKPKEMSYSEHDNAAQYGWNVLDDEFVVYAGLKSPKSGKHISLRARSYYIPFPWTFRRYRDYAFMRNAEWMDTTTTPAAKDDIQQWSMPFTYTTHHGEVQDATATAEVKKRVSRLAWFKWLPWPARTERYATFKFDKEIGHDNSGWKGGVMGASVTMQPHEEASDVLKRIIKEQRYG